MSNFFLNEIKNIYTSSSSLKWLENSIHNLNFFILELEQMLKDTKPNIKKIRNLYEEYYQDFFYLLRKTLEGSQEHLQKIKNNDNQFNEPAWSLPQFEFFKNIHTLNECFSLKLLTNLLNKNDKKHTMKFSFYNKLVFDAISPSNFIFTNPDILGEILKTGGKSIINGFSNLVSDLSQNAGRLNIRMTSDEEFILGKNIGSAQGKVVYQNSIMQLIQYQPQTELVYENPLLIVPAWVNKYYILDINEKDSLVNWIVSQGYTVFLISWFNPDENLTHDFEDYLFSGLETATQVIQTICQDVSINLMGVCLGGLLIAVFLSHLANQKKNTIQSVTYVTTLLDFSDFGLLGSFINDENMQMLQVKFEKKGYIEGGAVLEFFRWLRANDLIWPYYIKNYLKGDRPEPNEILFWNADPTNLSVKMLKFIYDHIISPNALVTKTSLKLKNYEIKFDKINTPAYFLSTEKDHIAPWQATYTGIHFHSGPTQFVLAGSGHVAGVINVPVKNKYYYFHTKKKFKQPQNFIKKAEKTSGSWLTHWDAWLEKYRGKQLAARSIEERLIIEDAPGSYVKKRVLF
jgi:polyhydroxyalkanoate synthase